MTDQFSAITIFCEDIREESAGTHTLIGIMPDNIAVQAAPFTFPKISVYTRILLSTDFDPAPMEIVLSRDSEKERKLAVIDAELPRMAIEQSKETGSSICGMISKLGVSPFQLLTEGRIRVY